MSNKIVTQKQVNELFHYDGFHLYWKISPMGKNKCGEQAGCIDGYGYITIGYKGSYYKEHRLIWLLIHGKTPDNIDHINHIRHDNRITNLREVTFLENSRNRRFDNKGDNPYNGITWNKRGRKWVVSISNDKKRVHLGYFNDLHEAISARLTANDHYGFHDNHGMM